MKIRNNGSRFRPYPMSFHKNQKTPMSRSRFWASPRSWRRGRGSQRLFQ